ncbi:MAG: 23S rRNA (guanosine(2251)-2'-O)-methyltransferase RlmB [Cyclobacteriaceae bacterium]
MEKRKNISKLNKFYKPARSNDDIIFGRHAVLEALKAGKGLEKLFIQKGTSGDSLNEIKTLVKSSATPMSPVPIEKLNRLTRKNHQGVVGILSLIEYSSLHHIISKCFDEGRNPLVVILDQITDVRNLGAIARSSECAGADTIVIPTVGSAQINSDAIKTSAGALNHIPVCKENNLYETCRYLKDSGIQLVACTEKSTTSYYKADLAGPVALIMGSEETGISNQLLKVIDQEVSIPMHGKIGSLNVSNAAAVMLFEVLRQRG